MTYKIEVSYTNKPAETVEIEASDRRTALRLAVSRVNENDKNHLVGATITPDFSYRNHIEGN